jgi:CHAT domain-containing protein
VSEDMYRNKLIRLRKKKAELEKENGREAKKLEKLNSEIAKAQKDMLRTKSQASRRSKARQIESKTKSAIKVQEKLAKIESDLAKNLSEQRSAQKQLDRAVEQRRKKEETREKKRQADRMRREKAVTREIQQQNRLYSERLTADQLRVLPEKIKVLVFAADPLEDDRLRLDREVRNIAERLRMAEYRDSVELESRWAVRPGDLLQALNEVKPRVVHFSGHGSEDELLFEDEAGNPKPISKEDMTRFIEVGSGHVRVVVFNACYTRAQAEAAARHVDVAIGMNASIGDETAAKFAEQFYSAIGFGASVKRAFDQALVRLGLEGLPGDKIPELFARKGVNPDEVVLVRPELETKAS